MINSGTLPIDDAREDLATANVDVFLAAVRDRGGVLAGDPGRDPAADRDGRFGWDLSMADGSVVRLLMPGVELIRVRDDLTAAGSPCLYVNGSAWWWAAAVGLIASPARWSASPRRSESAP
ncbi:hypothetical protein [Actinoplanes sp. NPDC049681]|uniref:hypothetical protein n=1 Tax=Actinoplanes sp. NPDC049681 TaxID=3363905 RepID=UPI0037917462